MCVACAVKYTENQRLVADHGENRKRLASAFRQRRNEMGVKPRNDDERERRNEVKRDRGTSSTFNSSL